MALSNAERQARHRARLKAAASSPANIRDLVIAFFEAHPEERPEGCTAIEAAEGELQSLVTLRYQIAHWRELYPHADLNALEAMFAGIEPMQRKRQR